MSDSGQTVMVMVNAEALRCLLMDVQRIASRLERTAKGVRADELEALRKLTGTWLASMELAATRAALQPTAAPPEA